MHSILRPNIYVALLCFAWIQILSSNIAYANLNLLIHSGASTASHKSTTFQGLNLSGQLLWSFDFLGLLTGVSGQQIKLKSIGAPMAKTATINLVGATMGARFDGLSSFLQFTISSYPISDFSTLGISEVRINGKGYGYSVVETHSGMPPIGARFEYLFKGSDRRLSKDQLLLYGLSVDGVAQAINKVSIVKSSSQESVLPSETNRDIEDSQIQILSVSLVLGFTL
ncbi:hypothetical protein [Pseudobacteriovorax antillogorgiicola]|uniref:Outer membrane protein beta-barrel domain-containing protein n=1 Tax=Pseudobacteriovorax antillogorgiicola TaxID=1513793 RepID=A0A1Y6BSA1_9BACT|nr:hypothetical protein [Pseudobacteriovorax antillogorgiicola]TCS54558.1 hypothetical protein EDD56_10671 [Pseudobacteriovorax antillogorgiicola]SMF18289.1 hypothetical protein SAMN06296036_106172 [Pseudobacteriovorax antillogorgiicola]